MAKIVVGLIPEEGTNEVNYLAQLEYRGDKIDSAKFPTVEEGEYSNFIEFEQFLYSFGDKMQHKVYFNLFRSVPDGLEPISGDSLMKLIRDNLITDEKTLTSLFVVMAQGSKFKQYSGNL